VANLDRALMRDAWHVLADGVDLPALLGDIHEGNIVEGALSLVSVSNLSGSRALDWPSSTGTLAVAGLAMAGENLPKLAGVRGTVEFARSNTKVQIEGGELDQLAVNSARLDWPRKGQPRLRATLQGELSAPLLRRALEPQGLEKLAGLVVIDAEAHGENE